VPCAQAVAAAAELTEITDTALHPLWSGQQALPGPRTVRFCASALLRSPEGQALGTLCVVDVLPRQLTPEQRRALLALATQASHALELARWRRRAGPEALRDATGAWSHDIFQQRLAEEWSRHARRGESLALLVLALDEAVAATDVLPQVLRAVGECLRASDHLSRQPGQRFAVLLPGSGLGSAMSAALRVRQALQQIEAERGDLGLCAGVAAMAPTPRGDPMQLLARAEHALRQTLVQGHPRIQSFSGWQA
jgi:diguanylate cyclase (GGDEF)-like protein